MQGRFVLLLAKGLLENVGLGPCGKVRFRAACYRNDLMKGPLSGCISGLDTIGEEAGRGGRGVHAWFLPPGPVGTFGGVPNTAVTEAAALRPLSPPRGLGGVRAPGRRETPEL